MSEPLEPRTLLAGQIYVTNVSGNKVGAFTTAGDTVNAALVPGGGTTYQDVAISGSYLFVSDYYAGTISEYTTSGAVVNASLVTGLNVNGTGPFGLLVSGNQLFVAIGNGGSTTLNGGIAEFTLGSTPGTIASSNVNFVTGLADCGSIAISGSNLFVTDYARGLIGEYTTSGATVNANLITGLQHPETLAVSGSNLFVANYDTNNVSEFTTTGATINASLISIPGPVGIAVSGSNLFIISGGTIGEYTTSGATVNASLISVPGSLALAVDGTASVTDPTFAAGSGGTVSIPFVSEQILQEPNGKILNIGHQGSTADNSSQGVIEQLNADGSLDTTFAPDLSGNVFTSLGANVAFYGGAVQSDGKIVAVGGSNGSFVVARYNADGSVDTSFGTSGIASLSFGAGASATASSVAIEPNGTIVVAGVENNTFAIARFTASGALDATFNPNGAADANFPAGGERSIATGGSGGISQIVTEPDGRIVGVGASGSGVAAFRLAPDGSNDPTFGSGGPVTTPLASIDLSAAPIVPGIALQPGGNVLVSGESPQGAFAAVRLDSNGTLDPTFGNSGVATASFGGANDDCTSITANPVNGEFLLIGTTSAGGTTQAAVAAFNPDGSVNTSFGTNGQFTFTAPGTLSGSSLSRIPATQPSPRPFAFHPQLVDFAFATFQADGKILVGASGTSRSAATRLSAVSSSGTPLGTFGKIGRKNVRLAPFTLPNGTVVSITIAGGSGIGTQVGNQLQLTLSGSPSVTIKTHGGSNTLGLSGVTCSGALRSFTAPTAILSGTLSCAGPIGSLRLASINGIVTTAGSITSLTAGAMSGSISSAGALRTAKLGVVSGTIAASQIRSFNAIALNAATILAGANLGSDGQLGGTATAQDLFAAGQILTMSIKGAVAASFIGAGVIPVDGIFGDGDDISAGASSAIRSLTVKGGLDASSHIEAHGLPKIVHLPGKVITAGDARFTHLT